VAGRAQSGQALRRGGGEIHVSRPDARAIAAAHPPLAARVRGSGVSSVNRAQQWDRVEVRAATHPPLAACMGRWAHGCPLGVHCAEQDRETGLMARGGAEEVRRPL